MSFNVVCLSGWGCPANWMTALADNMGRQCRLQVHGALSLKPAGIGDGGLSRYAAGLRDLLGKFPGGAWALGWSMGGAVAIETCLAHPKLFKGLILLGATARFTRAGGNEAGAGEASVKALARGLARDAQATLSSWLKIGARFPVISSEESRKMAFEALQTFSTRDLLEGLDYLLKADWRPGLASIRLPALVLHARNDALIAVETARMLAAAIPDASLKIYEQADHFFPMRRADEVAADALEFIEKFDGARRSRE